MKKLIAFGAALAVLVGVGVGFKNLASRGRAALPVDAKGIEALVEGTIDGIFDGNVEMVEETRPLAAFDSLAINDSGRVRVRVGAEPSIVVRAPAGSFDSIRTDVGGGELTISSGLRSGRSPEYEVVVPSLRAVTIRGSGDVVLDRDFRSEALTVRIDGSGDFDAAGGISADLLEVVVSGSGDFIASGGAKALKVTVNGSGGVDLDELDGESADIAVNGSGGVDLGEFRSLDVFIAGSGDVEYEGSPRLQASTPGSGRVRRD